MLKINFNIGQSPHQKLALAIESRQKVMKKEFQIILTAVMFYTRIPCPKWVNHSKEYLSKSVRYLPFIGWIVGGISAIVYIGSSYFLPPTISLILSIIASVLVTGAFHEDGLADVCDGFGGGWTKEKILTIMKDSSVGTYGIIALVLILFTKFLSITSVLELLPKNNISIDFFILLVFISGHSLSRFIAITVLVNHQYVRENEAISKAKLAVSKNLKWFSVTILMSAILGVLPLVFFQQPLVFILIIPMYLTKVFMIRFFNKWIGGYTGDCLGAIQQISEVVFYIGFIVLWKFI